MRIPEADEGARALTGDFLSFWFEPWRELHPSWIEGDPDAAQWLQGVVRGGAAQRFAYRLFCHRFDVDMGLPHSEVRRIADLPLDRGSVEGAALFVGMVSQASREDAASFWLVHGASLMTLEGVVAWREAHRFARARPLRAGASAPSGPMTRQTLTVQGLLVMRAALGLIGTGLWSRLRLRCDRSLVDLSENAGRGVASPPDAMTLRQVLRAWQRSKSMAFG